MLTDEAKIKVEAGKGGDGIVTFDKIKMALGPTGGRGGNGGSVYFEGVADIFALNKYRHLKDHYAEDGKKGRANRSDGPAGKDLFLTVPIGTVIQSLETKESLEITEVGQKILAAKGGIGGRGNFYFRSSKNTTPEEFEEGRPGEEFNFSLELRLIADVGLIGLPSAGKSSLLNELTSANAKVGAYHFTTLEPNLGAMDDFIIADIPGLIEGASSGKGLGIKFLRHIQRTKILVHCLSLESNNILKDYEIIRKELSSYNTELLKKKELVLLTKSDLVSPKDLKKKIKEIKTKIKQDVLPISIHNFEEIEAFKKKLSTLLSK
ncbi:MAG TPA: Obg family GTPase CgtA [Candidatus Moranbacteria bacterium]|nr:Obg family GTPase CgtA [Candidatus Moranbacteria bacterium]